MNYDILKTHNMKLTTQRKLVFDAINNLGEESTLKNIVDSTNGNVDKSTVYRILENFIFNNIIYKSINSESEIAYFFKENHAHYISCIKCHKVKKLKKCPMIELNTIEGFDIISHNLTIEGICSDCKNK